MFKNNLKLQKIIMVEYSIRPNSSQVKEKKDNNKIRSNNEVPPLSGSCDGGSLIKRTVLRCKSQVLPKNRWLQSNIGQKC